MRRPIAAMARGDRRSKPFGPAYLVPVVHGHPLFRESGRGLPGNAPTGSIATVSKISSGGLERTSSAKER